MQSPHVVAAAKAYRVVRSAQRIRDGVSPQQRQALAAEWQAMTLALTDLKAALRSARGARQQKQLERLAESARSPSLEFQLAKRVVEVLRERGAQKPSELAGLVGAAEGDRTFRQALACALAEDHIQRTEAGSLQARSQDTVLAGDTVLREIGQIDEVADQIAAYVEIEGLVRLDALRAGLNIDRSKDPALPRIFEAALVRALTEGMIEWVAPFAYALDATHLERRDEPVAEAPRLKDAMKRLVTASQSLATAVGELEGGRQPSEEGAHKPRISKGDSAEFPGAELFSRDLVDESPSRSMNAADRDK